MEASDTGEIEAVHLEHLDVKSMSKLNQIIGALKRMVQGNARITLTLSGGHIDEMEPCKVVHLLPDGMIPGKPVN